MGAQWALYADHRAQWILNGNNDKRVSAGVVNATLEEIKVTLVEKEYKK